MGTRHGFRNDSRRKSDVLSCRIRGEERVKWVTNYCRTKGIGFSDLIDDLVDTFFAGEEFRLLSLSKEELVRMVMEGKK